MPRLAPLLLLLALMAPALDPAPARAQGTAELVAIGGAVGVAGGAVITLATVVARARWQRVYLDSADDLIHWQSTPMIAAPAAGVVFALAGRDALEASIAGSTTGMLLGAATGAGLGWLLSDQQEWPWAGGVIGAGVGLTVGGLAAGLLAWGDLEEPGIEVPEIPFFLLRVPLP